MIFLLRDPNQDFQKKSLKKFLKSFKKVLKRNKKFKKLDRAMVRGLGLVVGG